MDGDGRAVRRRVRRASAVTPADLLAAQAKIIDLIAGNRGLEETLRRIALFVEEVAPPSLCSILLIEPDGRHLKPAAGPSLPAQYTAAIGSVEIGPSAASCGTAVWRRAPVSVCDIASDPLWEGPLRALALSCGLEACWSMPLSDAAGVALGTIAMYFREPRAPTGSDLALLTAAASLVQMALAQDRKAAAVRESEARLRHATEAAKIGTWELDLRRGTAVWCDRMKAIMGVPAGFQPNFGSFIELLHPDDVQPFKQRIEASRRQGGSGSEVDLRIVRADDGAVRWISLRGRYFTDGEGRPHRTFGICSDITERKLAEERLRATVGALQQGLIVVDSDGVLRLWNSRARELLDLPDELLGEGRSGHDIVQFFAQRGDYGPGAPSEVMTRRLAELAPGDSVTTERTLPNGRTVLHQMAKLPDGGRVHSYTEVTLLKQRERELAEKEALLRATLENLDQGVLAFDREARLMTWNERARELLDLPDELLREGAAGRDFVQLFAARGSFGPGDPGELGDRRLAALRAGEISTLEATLPNGRTIVQHRNVVPNGSRVHAIHSFADVTDLRRRQRQLAEKEGLLRATLDNVDQGIVLLDRDLRLKLWNDRSFQLLDVPPGMFDAGQPFIDFLRSNLLRSGVPRQECERMVEERLHSILQNPMTIIDRRPRGGRVIERRRTTTPEGDIVLTYTDMTDRHEAQEALQRAKNEAELASRTKTEFLANMSHELRTPLNAVIGFSELMLGEQFGPLGSARYVEYAGAVLDSGRHLLRLINDVLDVSRIEAGGFELDEDIVDAEALIGSCERLVRQRAAEGGVALVLSAPTGASAVRADPRRLKQALLNLMSNAVKFTPRGGSVAVAWAGRPDGLTISVADTGIGIAPEDIATALRPFGQVDGALSRKFEGAGLGLPLAKSLIELHGGRLQLDSAPGRGTNASLWLPPNRLVG